MLLAVVGFGIYSFMNRRVDVVDDSELQGLDELVVNEIGDLPAGEPRPLATATITGVVPAVHNDAMEDAGGSVQLAAHTNGVRPQSNPPVWLSGTIEELGPEPAGNRQRMMSSPSQRFDR